MHETPQAVPDLRFVDGDGRETSLSAFEGTTILLNVWATWCVPCREEMPALDRLEAKLGSAAFRVVPLSIDRGGLEKVKAFYRELGLKALPIYVDETGKASQQLATIGIPTTLLIGREGQEPRPPGRPGRVGQPRHDRAPSTAHRLNGSGSEPLNLPKQPRKTEHEKTPPA
ncbi:TlpA disulfide reductase family protein (plasmid) [Jiella pelagia]|uniref:TlpA disulfide reductase family protein n=2 Tax=Jiella pelagia TaxID=2986949 RepID=A0ABY7C6C5_9HYPH|nr:TlpA disulfide reductase family protein [Jiella pelagia]